VYGPREAADVHDEQLVTTAFDDWRRQRVPAAGEGTASA
jgi:hypothetical protein